MGVIAVAASVAAGLLVGIAGNIIAHDIGAVLPKICTKIIRRAAAKVGPLDGGRYQEEWLSDLAERDALVAKVAHSLGCYLSAGRMRTQAAQFDMRVTYKVADIGDVATEMRIHGLVARLMVFALLRKVRLISYPIAYLGVFYFRVKMLEGARWKFGEEKGAHLRREFKDVLKSDFEIIVQWRGQSIDITAAIAEYRRDRVSTIAKWKEGVAAKVHEYLTARNAHQSSGRRD